MNRAKADLFDSHVDEPPCVNRGAIRVLGSLRIGTLMRVLLAAHFLLLAFPSWYVSAAARELITVTDAVGREVTVPLDPERIVGLAPGTLRLICYLARQDRVVGVEQMEKTRPVGRPYWLANSGLCELPTAGPGGMTSVNAAPDLEVLLKLKPDVVFVSYMNAALADEVQTKLGTPVVVVSYGPFATFDPIVYDSMRIMGRILKAEDRAEKVISFIESCRSDLLRRIQNVDSALGPRVYVGAVGFKGLQGIESTHSSYVPLTWIKARNIASELGKPGHIFIDKEQLLKWNPGVIFVDAGGIQRVKYDFNKSPEFYKSLKAFQMKRVYLLHPFNWYVTNIDTGIADAYAAGKILYPREFEDIDVKHRADEIYTFLLGKAVHEMMERDYGQLGGWLGLDYGSSEKQPSQESGLPK